MSSASVSALEVMDRLHAWFGSNSWGAWRVLIKAIFALPMTEEETTFYRRSTGREMPPSEAVAEAFLIIGRRGGKSLIAALVAVWAACFRSYAGLLAPGERGVVMIIAADRRQARVVFRYVAAFFDRIPSLGALVQSRTAEALHLRNGISIEIHTASFRAVRGPTVVYLIADELAFWRDENSANPDTEILAAIRPAMATVPGAQLIAISSPYARRGALWEAYRKHFGKDDAHVLVWQADTRAMNPTVDRQIIADAYDRDPLAAAAEYGAEFRSDLESFVSREALVAITIPGRLELAPQPGRRYVAFKDPAGGSGQDADAVAIAHAEVRDGRVIGVLDCVRFSRPPFSPSAVTAEHAELLRRYGVREVTGDRFAGSWPAEEFTKHGITYRPSEYTKGQIYQNCLPLINSAQLEWLDLPTLRTEALGLERRTAWGGRDSIDHAPHGHDDVVNVVAGACLLAVTGQTHAVTPASIAAWGEATVNFTRENDWRIE
jgi:hypothetical protein